MRRYRLIEKSPIEEASVNLTPLIDVVFVVLITFMIISPMLEMEKVQLASSGASALPVQPSGKTLLITIKKGGFFFMKGQRMDLQSLKAHLNSQSSRESLQVAIEDSAPYGSYQKLKNLAEEAGFQEITVLLNPH